MKDAESLFFGNGSRLFGMYHPPTGQSRNHGIVICAPLFHEYYRSHFVLRKVAGDLANKGFDVLRFDYSGVGDSQGSLPDDLFNTWSEEIGVAMQEVRDLSGCKNVALITARFSASLGCCWQSRSSKHVSWDPVLDQQQYSQELDEMSAASLAEHSSLPADARDHHEQNDFLGTRWPRKKLNERLLAFAPNTGAQLREASLDDSVHVRSDVSWISASLAMIYAHDTANQIIEAF